MATPLSIPTPPRLERPEREVTLDDVMRELRGLRGNLDGLVQDKQSANERMTQMQAAIDRIEAAHAARDAHIDELTRLVRELK